MIGGADYAFGAFIAGDAGDGEHGSLEGGVGGVDGAQAYLAGLVDVHPVGIVNAHVGNLAGGAFAEEQQVACLSVGQGGMGADERLLRSVAAQNQAVVEV